MRSFYIFLLLLFPLALQSAAQEPENEFELKFSLIHPVRGSVNYEFSVDPAIEFFYRLPISKRYLFSGGLMFQAGKHKWDEYTAHTIYPEEWGPFPLKGVYDRRYKYLSAGIPLKIEKLFKNSFLSSLYTEFTAGRYFQIDLKDYYNWELIYSFDIGYHGLFWDLQFGLTKDFYQIEKFSLAASTSVGVRSQQLDGYINKHNLTKYFYYGFGVSARLKK